MSDFKVINTHNTISYTYYNYSNQLINLHKADRLTQEEAVSSMHTKAMKAYQIILEGIEVNIEEHRSKGEYRAIAPTIIIYDKAGMGEVKEKRAVTAQEWKDKYYPEILERFKNGFAINGLSIVPKGYRPDFIEAKDGGLGWIHAVYSELDNKIRREAESVILDKEYVTADGLDPEKEKEKRILVDGANGKITKKVKDVFTEHDADRKAEVITSSIDADYKERGYISEAKHRKRLETTKQKGGSVTG